LRCFAGQGWEWDGVRFDMLHPALESYREERVKSNDRSCVLKITTGHGSILLPADAELPAEREMLARSPELLPASVLVAPHHGSKTSSSEDFIALVHPETVVFTVGYRNHYGHPKPEIVERYRRLGAALRRSDTDGALLFRFEAGAGAEVQAWREVAPRYWRNRQ
jgi:competence protein ComEC